MFIQIIGGFIVEYLHYWISVCPVFYIEGKLESSDRAKEFEHKKPL